MQKNAELNRRNSTHINLADRYASPIVTDRIKASKSALELFGSFQQDALVPGFIPPPVEKVEDENDTRIKNLSQ